MAAKRYVDGGALADRIIRVIDQHSGDHPLFLWTHFLDTHVPYCPGRAGSWYREAPDYLRVLGYDPGLDPSVPVSGRPATDADWDTWSAYYDATVRYIDEQIGRIVQALDRNGIADKTLLVFCADHGEELGDHGDISHHFRFYSHNVRVPLLFHGAGVSPGRSMRLRPLSTLFRPWRRFAELTRIPNGKERMRSRPLSPSASTWFLNRFTAEAAPLSTSQFTSLRETSVLTSCGRKIVTPATSTVRTDPNFMTLIADPGERNNIYSADHPEIAAFERAIALRLAEIPEFAPGRFDGKFATIAPSGAAVAAK